MKKTLKRFAFVTITSATFPRKVAEKTILAEQDTNPNIVQLSKKVIDNIKVNCSDKEIAKERRAEEHYSLVGTERSRPARPLEELEQ